MTIDIGQRYRTARLGLAEGTAITVLHIGEQETAVATGTGIDPNAVLMLAIGFEKTATEFFLHTPPTPGELENAIMQVEDEITSAREMIAGYSLLATTDEGIRDIAQFSGVHAGLSTQISIDVVEQVFSFLANYSLGSSAGSAVIPDSPAFSAILLILREFMHHLKFSSIRIAN